MLFYHKKAHYTFGASPLVVWLKAYMMPEILGIKIPDNLAALAPSSYKNFASHADDVRQRKQDQKEGKGRGRGRRCGRNSTSASESMDSDAIDSCLDDTSADPPAAANGTAVVAQQ